jgi:hypothetical protein
MYVIYVSVMVRQILILFFTMHTQHYIQKVKRDNHKYKEWTTRTMKTFYITHEERLRLSVLTWVVWHCLQERLLT